MKKATVKLKSLTPVTFGKFHQMPPEEKELPDAYERRTWREKAHYTDDGFVKIPGTMIGNCIRESAKFLSLQIPGKGKSTYSKHFDAGIIIYNDIKTTVHKNDLQGHIQHVPSDGTPGGSRRVLKVFPIIQEWSGQIEILIGDEIITADVFEKVLRNAGQLIGLGTWRPRNRGMNGRFELVSMKWSDNNK
jgi:hypothetical protein